MDSIILIRVLTNTPFNKIALIEKRVVNPVYKARQYNK